jgi:hypothetical protein
MRELLSPELMLDRGARWLSYFWQALALPFHAGRLAAIRMAVEIRTYAQTQELRQMGRLLEQYRDELQQAEELVADADLVLHSSRRLLSQAMVEITKRMEQRLTEMFDDDNVRRLAA